MKEICKVCGLALGLTGQREQSAACMAEWLACRNPKCSLYAKPQQWRQMPRGKAVNLPEQTEEIRSARAAFVARRMAQKRH
ncbi:MAG: hypothetical protein IJ347_05780 [Faecalibacterium sp.]|nr:hypothetical protein [Faecalibacterium sp.]